MTQDCVEILTMTRSSSDEHNSVSSERKSLPFFAVRGLYQGHSIVHRKRNAVDKKKYAFDAKKGKFRFH